MLLLTQFHAVGASDMEMWRGFGAGRKCSFLIDICFFSVSLQIFPLSLFLLGVPMLVANHIRACPMGGWVCCWGKIAEVIICGVLLLTTIQKVVSLSDCSLQSLAFCFGKKKNNLMDRKHHKVPVTKFAYHFHIFLRKKKSDVHTELKIMHCALNDKDTILSTVADTDC